MGSIEKLKAIAQEHGWSAAYAHGYSEGGMARDRREPLTPYVRVGIDDYARGYRAGFFARGAAPALAAERDLAPTRHVVGL